MRNRSITKQDLITLLNEYNGKKGIRRTIFGSTRGIKDLSHFVIRQLANHAHPLTTEEENQLINLLAQRYQRIRHTKRSYRHAPTKLTNKLYTTLAHLITADDPTILALVQKYQNDYDPPSDGIKPSLFVTAAHHIIPLNKIAPHIKKTNSLSYPISETLTLRFSTTDIERLSYYPVIKNEIDNIKKIAGKRLFLFYTKPEEIRKKEQAKPEEIRKKEQVIFAEKISVFTIDELKELAEALLNISNESLSLKEEMTQAYGNFYEYYRYLSTEEKTSLDNYWIQPWSSNFEDDSVMEAIQFAKLYQSRDKLSLDVARGYIIKLVLQLNPHLHFDEKPENTETFIERIRIETLALDSPKASRVKYSS